MMDITSAGKAAPARLRFRPRQQAPSTARETALASAALYRLLSLAFSNPEPQLVHSVVKGCGELKAALSPGTLPVRIAHALKAADEEWRAASIEQLADEYSRLFLGAGLVPLREGGFGGGSRFAGEPAGMADVSGFYLAFGFALPDLAASPPDSLGAELEFMSLLNLKLALALQRRRTEHARITRTAMAHFLEDHLGSWAEAFEAALVNASAAPAYRTMGGLLARTVETDCARLNVRPLKARDIPCKAAIGTEELVCPFSAQNGHNDNSRPGALDR